MDRHNSIVETAEYPEFVLKTTRLASFIDWPKCLRQKPDQLSDAGFFYIGKGDRVICFCCGGGLRQWGEDDDVWEEHGFHYNNCKYMQLCKGLNFHDEIVKKREKKSNHETQNDQEEHITNIKRYEEKEGGEEVIEKPNECPICCVNKYNTVFIPCGHVYACTRCASSLLQCPLCRESIGNVLRIFLP